MHEKVKLIEVLTGEPVLYEILDQDSMRGILNTAISSEGREHSLMLVATSFQVTREQWDQTRQDFCAIRDQNQIPTLVFLDHEGFMMEKSILSIKLSHISGGLFMTLLLWEDLK